MKVEIQRKEKEITFIVEGRLDTTTVPELENQIPDLEGIEKITFDFEDVEYISSSGLRLILKIKKVVDDTSVINCNREVYNVFDVTGFDEMMTIKKALRKISIDNCELIGEGFYGKIYRLDPETIVKVYKISEALDMVTRETQIAKKAFVMGIPTAIPYDIVKVGDQYGAVFELLNAEPVANLINSEEALDDFAKKCADVLKDMHQKEGDFPSRKEAVKGYLEKCKNLLPNEVYNKLLSLLNSIPDTNHIVHSDFHLKNIMAQKDELLLIDMETLSVGHPIFEFGSMYATYIAFSCVDKENTDKFIGMPLQVTTKLFNKIFRYYYNDKKEEQLKDMEEKISIIAYIQVLYIRSKFADLSYGKEKEEVEFCQKYLTEEANKLDTLEFKEGVTK